MNPSFFKPSLFKFLRELKRNNNRPWFRTHKERYERMVRDPLLDFIGEVGRSLRTISPHLVADNSPSGGSMFRIYRDTRFSKDKTPYKTHAAAHFPLSRDRNVHSPGFYLHLSPGEVFVGGGIWHPEKDVLGAIRDHLAQRPSEWKAVLRDKDFQKHCTFEGEKLQRPPKGYPPDHELIEWLKHKDFTYFAQFDERQACSPGFLEKFLTSCRAGVPLMRFLAEALKLPW